MPTTIEKTQEKSLTEELQRKFAINPDKPTKSGNFDSPDVSLLAFKELVDARKKLELAYSKIEPKEYQEEAGNRFEKILIENLRYQTKLFMSEPTKKEDQFGHIDLFIIFGDHSYALDFYTGSREDNREKKFREKKDLPRILIHIREDEIEEAIKHSKGRIPGTNIPLLPKFLVEKMVRQISNFINKDRSSNYYTVREKYQERRPSFHKNY